MDVFSQIRSIIYSALGIADPSETGKKESHILESDDILTENALYDYPERRGVKYNESSIFPSHLLQQRCEYKLLTALKNYPILKTIEKAMKAHGCELDYRRHFSCEPCRGFTTGGFDSYYNQVVICSNRLLNKSTVIVTLAHEMIHMFDFCRAKLDFKNPEHTACSEIRAANLVNCSYLDSTVSGATKFYKLEKSQQDCVRAKAFYSMRAAYPDLKDETILSTIDKVFDKCYNDLEPFGRRVRRIIDSEFAYRERYIFGYDTD